MILCADERLFQCDPNAECVNKVGTYGCQCLAGYDGDGKTCINRDECALGVDSCDSNAQCFDTDGSFTCACNAGYEGDGMACADKNECLNPLDNDCSESGKICFNTVGSFECRTPATPVPTPALPLTTCPDGVAFSPILGNGGTTLSISSEDDANEIVNLGFDFKWLGGDTAVRRVRVSTNGQINIRSDDSDTGYGRPAPIGAYGKPRIAVAKEDLNPRSGGNVATLINMGTGSVVISWEQVNFYRSVGDVNAQAELFANDAVNICYGEGDMAGHVFAAGTEGGGVNDPYWNGGDVAIPISDDEYFDSDGITSSWPTNKCYCYTS